MRKIKVSTPLKNVHKQKVDFRQLFPMFKKAYVKTETEDGGHRNSYKTQTLKTICVGASSDSDALLFYHPKTKQVLTAADGYKFDTRLPAGPQHLTVISFLQENANPPNTNQ